MSAIKNVLIADTGWTAIDCAGSIAPRLDNVSDVVITVRFSGAGDTRNILPGGGLGVPANVLVEGSHAGSGDKTIQVLRAITPFRIGGGEGGDPHLLGGTQHIADVLANLNAKISDATLVPATHAHLGGSDGAVLNLLKGALDDALTGTVTVSASSAAVVGVGTAFNSELWVGDAIKIAGEIFSVQSIADDTHLTLDSDHAAGASGVTAYRDPDLYRIQTGDGAERLTLTKSGFMKVGDGFSPTHTLAAPGDFGIKGKLEVDGAAYFDGGAFFYAESVFVGGSVGIGATPNAASILDLTSTTQGFLAPRMTNTQRDAISSPVAALLLWSTTDSKFNYYNGSAWRSIVNSPTSTIAVGGIPFGHADGCDCICTDVANLSWDDTAKSLGIGTNAPAASAILDLTSTAKGFLPPRMTTTQRDAISSPADGLVVWDATLSKLAHYDGAAWREVADETDLHSHANKTELDLVTDGDHDVRTDNPHTVTAAQAGAEAAFSKNTAFNKDFGDATATVLEGDNARVPSGDASAASGAAVLTAALTEKSIPYVDSSGQLAQNNTALAWVNADQNFGFRNGGTQFGGGIGVIGIGNRATAPGSNPVGGGVLYAEGGALKWRGSGGTITEIAPT